MGQENCPILHSNVSLTTIVAMLHMTAYCFTLQSVILTPHIPFTPHTPLPLSHPLLSLPFSIYISSLFTTRFSSYRTFDPLLSLPLSYSYFSSLFLTLHHYHFSSHTFPPTETSTQDTVDSSRQGSIRHRIRMRKGCFRHSRRGRFLENVRFKVRTHMSITVRVLLLVLIRL